MTCKEIDIFNKNLNKNKFKIIKYIKKKTNNLTWLNDKILECCNA